MRWSIEDMQKARAEKERAERTRYFFGVDLGQVRDYTAVAVIERLGLTADDGELCEEPVCNVVQFRRYPVGTPYLEMVDNIAEHFGRSPGKTKLVIDATGVGRAVVDMLSQHPIVEARNSDNCIAVTITAGFEEKKVSRSEWHCPKRNLVGAVQVLLQTGRLKINANLPDTLQLINELENFKARITAAGNEIYGAGADWRVGNNDDLVLAVSLACWAATHPKMNTVAKLVVW